MERLRRLRGEEREAELETTLRTFQTMSCPECRLRADELLAARDFYAKAGAHSRGTPSKPGPQFRQGGGNDMRVLDLR